jgi:DNA processing protein
MTPSQPLITKIKRGDTNYPVRLEDLFDPPDFLYIYGDKKALQQPMIAIVGSRRASTQGMQNAALFAQSLARSGMLVLSGLARGIDGAAHKATLGLGENHLTAAVCGTGIDQVYPKEHFDLAQAIGRQGLLISELPLGAGPKPFHFPRRNRIIAALSLGVLVIEAAERSGSLITARIAAELGREVFALPGTIHDPLFGGCHQLIQQGAKLVRSPEDVLEELIFPKNLI